MGKEFMKGLILPFSPRTLRHPQGIIQRQTLGLTHPPFAAIGGLLVLLRGDFPQYRCA